MLISTGEFTDTSSVFVSTAALIATGLFSPGPATRSLILQVHLPCHRIRLRLDLIYKRVVINAIFTIIGGKLLKVIRVDLELNVQAIAILVELI